MPDGVVYGFEMDDVFFELLTRNIEENNCSNVEAFNVAVCDCTGVVKYRRDSNRYSSGFRLRTDTTDENDDLMVLVESVALDDFLQSKGVVPDVIKVDVEGAEMDVLKGMRQTLQDHKPTLFLEVHPGYLPDFNTSIAEILSLLVEFDYRVYEIENMRNQESDGQLAPLAPDADVKDNAMLYATATGLNGSNPA
jgi:FkbM family methyltransferase